VIKKELANKIKQIILDDRMASLRAYQNALKSDLYGLLQSYLFDIGEIEIDIDTQDGFVRLAIVVAAHQMQNVGNSF